MCHDSNYSGLKTVRQVSLHLRLSDLEMNWTSSFLVQSDKHAIVLQLHLAPVGTVEASRARSCSSSESDSGGVPMLSAES